MTDRPTVLVSACLLGIPCRYDGTDNRADGLVDRLSGCHLVPVCPEQLGGLPTPRPRSQMTGGDGTAVLEGTARCINELGHDVTDAFCRGAEATATIARLTGARRAVLAAKSPSCGAGRVWVDQQLTDGRGVAAAALLQEGLALEVIDP